MTARRLAAVAAALAVAAGWALPVYRDGPPPGHTGGFGQPLCSECHFGAPINADPGSLAVAVPEAYAPGRRYSIELSLEHPELAAGGFQLAIRFAEGARAGEQAGTVESVSPRTTVTADSGVSYAQQTVTGSRPDGPGAIRWTVAWTAPEADAPVVLHAAANAANDDASEFGDFIYATSAVIAPGRSRRPGSR